MLKLNQDKTELIVFTSKQNNIDLSDFFITFDGSIIKPVPVVRNLGAYFDTTLNMEKHTSAVSKSCYFHIRNIGRIRNLVDDNTCKTLMHALVTTRLDYANALMIGVPVKVIQKLQRVHNTAERIVTGTS